MGTSCSTHKVAELFPQLYVSLQCPRFIFSFGPLHLHTYFRYHLHCHSCVKAQNIGTDSKKDLQVMPRNHSEMPIIEVYSYQHAIPVINCTLFVTFCPGTALPSARLQSVQPGAVMESVAMSVFTHLETLRLKTFFFKAFQHDIWLKISGQQEFCL